MIWGPLVTSRAGTRLKVLFCHCKRQSFRQHQKKILKLSEIDKRISTFEISLFDFEKYCYFCTMFLKMQSHFSININHKIVKILFANLKTLGIPYSYVLNFGETFTLVFYDNHQWHHKSYSSYVPHFLIWYSLLRILDLSFIVFVGSCNL